MKERGFTLVEILIAVFIFSLMAGGFFIILSSGQSVWHTTDVAVSLQQNLRQAMQRVTRELHESGFSQVGNCVAACKVIIQDGAGANGSDILSFQVPVDLDNDGIPTTDLTDCGCCPAVDFPSCYCGKIIQWGAPLLWADKINNCGGGNNHCQYLNYKIQYRIDDQSQFIREVLDSGDVVVRIDIFAERITDFQVSFVNPVDKTVVSIQISAQRNTVFGRSLTSTLKADVLLRNRG